MSNLENIDLQTIIKDINMYRVASSNIVALGYNPKSQVLRVIFSFELSNFFLIVSLSNPAES